MGAVEDPERWHRDTWHGPWHRGDEPWRSGGPFGLRHRRGNGGPMRRDPGEGLAGGLAAGVAAWRGFNVTTVRIVFVLVGLFGWFVPLYVAAWLFIPAAGAEANIASKARNDSAGIRLAVGLASLMILVLLVAGAFHDGWFISWAWPQVFSVAGLALIWRNAPEQEQASLRRVLEPLGASPAPGTRRAGRAGRGVVLRLILSGLLLAGGLAGCSRPTRTWRCCARWAGCCW